MKMTIGTIKLPLYIGGITELLKFVVLDESAIYNVILEMPWIYIMKAVPSTYHKCVKLPTPDGTYNIKGNERMSRTCFVSERKLRNSSTLHIRGKNELYPQSLIPNSPKCDLITRVSLDSDNPE